MIDAMYVAATGMHSGQTQIDTISNNLANLNTVGFKKSQVRFDDLVYRDALSSSAVSALSATIDSGAAGAGKVGMGAAVASINKVFSEGDPKPTDNPLDLAIAGSGFFEVELENGELAYTRNGNFQLNDDGFLETGGNILADRIQFPPDVSGVVIGSDGKVSVRIDGEEATTDIGAIGVSYFLNETGLEPLGSGIYLATQESGRALYANAGENGVGELRQGYVEASNVDMVEELINLTIAQRGFEVNSQVLKASDQIMQIINNLRS